MSLLFQSLAGRPAVGLLEGEHRVTVITSSGLLNARLDTLQVFINGDLITRIDNIESNLAEAVWPVARTISLAGPFTGAVSIDGSQDVTLTVTVPNNALPKSAIVGLEAQLTGIETDLLSIVDDIADLQGSLAGKVNVGDTVDAALRLAASRSFSISGAVSAEAVSFDGSGNVNLNVTVADNAFSISKVSGLTTALAGKLDVSLLGVPNGIATLGSDGRVPIAQVPPIFDDVLEYNTFTAFPASGESGKIYIDLDTGDVFRWSGSAYVNVGVASSIANAALKWLTPRLLTLAGKVSGSVSLDGSQDVTLNVNAVDLTKADVGLGNVDNTSDLSKPVSTATQTALDLKANLTSPTFAGIPRAPTAAVLTNDTQVATTAYATAKVEDYAPSKLGAGASGTWGISISGTSALATALATSRNFSITGAVTASAVAFDGNGNVVLNTTLADGTRGEITVGSAGATWTINNGAVTLAKIANIATATILGNNTAGAAAPIALTAAQTRTVLGLGTSATVNTGTSGANIPLLNGALTWSGANTFSSTVNFTGAVGQGGAPAAGRNFVLNSNIAGSTTAIALTTQGVIQSAVNVAASYVHTTAATQAAAFTLPTLTHFNATQGTFGAGSTVTLQQGFVADATMIGGGTNYGFRGRIPSGTNRWNLFMDGTANNAIAGNLRLGSTVAPTTTLDVTGDAAISGALTVGGFAVSVTGHTHTAAHITSGTFDIARLPVATSGTSSDTQVVRADDSRLSDARTPTNHAHTASQITDFNNAVQNVLNAASISSRFRIVTVGETLGLIPVMAILTSNQDFPLPATFEAGDRFFFSVGKQSTAGVIGRIVVTPTQTIIGAGLGNDVSLQPGEAVHLVATSSNTLEILA